MGVPTIPLMHPDLYKLDMLAFVLGLGSGSRLAGKFEHDPTRAAIATGIGAGSLTPVYGAGRLACFFGTDTIENARGLAWEVWEEMNRLKEELVSEEEIARALKVYEKYYYMGRATVDDRAESLASSLAWLNDPVYGDQYMERIREVTPEQVREAARTYLVEEKLNVVIVKPPEPEAVQDRAELGEGEGKVRKVVLDNGLTVLLKRIPDYGMVDVAAAFNGGVIYETEETNGLFFLIGEHLLARFGEPPLGPADGGISTASAWISRPSRTTTSTTTRCTAWRRTSMAPSTSTRTCCSIPPSTSRSSNHFKMLVLTRVLPNLGVDANEMMQKTIRNKLYEHSPYRMQRYGTPESVASFTAEQARSVYETFTRPNNGVLAIYGDIDLDATQALVERSLGGWERGEIPASSIVEEPPLEERAGRRAHEQPGADELPQGLARVQPPAGRRGQVGRLGHELDHGRAGLAARAAARGRRRLRLLGLLPAVQRRQGGALLHRHRLLARTTRRPCSASSTAWSPTCGPASSPTRSSSSRRR